MKTNFPMKMKVRDGVRFYEDGTEVLLWGNNFQPNLYWEYKFRMEHMGLPMTPEVMKEMCDDGFRDLEKMGCDLIRCHRDAWQWHADGELVTKLDDETVVAFKLKLPGYQPIRFTERPGTYSLPLVKKNQKNCSLEVPTLLK